MGRVSRCLVSGRTRVAPFVCLAVALALAGPVTRAAAAEAAPNAGALPRLQVTGSSASGLSLAVDGLEPVWTAAYTGSDGLVRWSLAIGGFVTGGAPGAPRVPSGGAWIVVPPGMRPVVKVLGETWQTAEGRLLAVETTPVRVPGAGDEPDALNEMLLEPGAALPDGIEALVVPGVAAKGHAGAAVTVDAPVWWRGRRVAACRIVPVRYEAAGAAQQTLAAGRWEIAFVPDASKAAMPAANARMTSGANDARFAAAFLNGGLLSALPTEGRANAADMEKATLPARVAKAGTLLGPEARLAVSRTGPVRVTYARLRQRGLIPDVPILESQVRLYQRRYLERLDDGAGAPYVEVEVPLHMVGEGDAFDGDDFFVFYGLRLRDDAEYVGDAGAGPELIPGSGDAFEMNNETNLYWLACAAPTVGGPWARMATTTLPASSGTPLANFRHTAHVEEQAAYRENLPSTTTDRMYLNLHTDAEASIVVSPFWRPDPAGATANIGVAVAGFNSVARPLRFELVTDTANVTLLEDYNLATSQTIVRNYTVSAAALDGATSKVRMSRGVGASPYLFAYLNWAAVAYDALYATVGNELRFHGGDVAGARPIEVTGFTSADVGLLEITDPRAPVLVTMQAGNVVADGGGWKLSVMPTQSGTRRVFHAMGNFGTTGAIEFNYVKSTVADDPTDPTQLAGGNPDLVVVTHKTFRAALDRWVQHRVARSGGALKVHVVDVDDIYDWYSGGLRDPWAVKRFCDHALTAWESWALVTVGDANENALGKRVIAQADSWATDWVPTHYHTQHVLSYEPELMASDKWYASLQYGQDYPAEDFPASIAAPFDMLAGRLPCNSVAELDVMIDKIIALEAPQAGQDWRRRGIFIADDEWSNGYGAEALLYLQYQPGELDFLESERDSMSTAWAQRAGVPLESTLVTLKSLLDPQFPYTGTTPENRLINAVRQYTAAAATPVLLSALNTGGIVANYQGHANQYVLSSEYWMQDMPTVPNLRSDVSLLTNTGRPWFFIGLGCHIADWAQNPVKSEQVPQERCISEKMLLRPAAGASGVYASSGYEFITANRSLGEYIFRRWCTLPPAPATSGPGGSAPGRSRWVLGEILWAAEADLAADRPVAYPFPDMIAQYVLLGDPLLTLDGGEPVVEAVLHGTADETVSGSVELAALDDTNIRTLTITARDEAGIDRLVVLDGQGADITSQVSVESLPPGARTTQRADYALTVPVRPYDHALTVRVYDTGAALAGDRHWELTLDMPQTAQFTADGEVLDPATFVFATGVPVAFHGAVTSAAWITPAMEKTLTSSTLELTGVSFGLDKGHGLTVDFTATAGTGASAVGHSVILTIDGQATELVLQQAEDTGGVAGIGRVLNYPNPMGDQTRFLVETEQSGQGSISLWSVAGSTVAKIAFTASGGDDVVVDWDGRDARGDELANGTYLYQVEIAGAQGPARSEVQRLVIMR
jgi:hypothetical protein